MEKYDVVIIGGGPAGYAAAMRAMDFSLKTLLIEQEKIGGAGLYNGVLSSKTMWELSKDVNLAQKRVKKYSTCGDFKLDYEQVKKELNNAIKERGTQLEHHLNELKNVGYRDIFFQKYGKGKLITKNEVEITDKNGEQETVYAKNIILATGSKPRYLPHIPIDEKTIVTSDGIHDWDELPESMVVLGAGVIGCEYATIFSNFGKTKVFIIDKQPRILPFEDGDVVQVVEQKFIDNGIHIHRKSNLVRIEIKEGRVEYELEFEGGKTEIFNVEKALISIGRVPNTQGLGLEDIGVALTDRGAVKDVDTKTNIPNIYAIGDLTADIALVNVGELEGRQAIKHIANKNPAPLDYSNICSIMFLKPIVAGVGINELQARAKGISYQVVSIDYSIVPRGIAMRNPAGFFKILVTNDTEMKVLGMRVVGPQASTAIQAVGLLMSQNMSIEALAELIHPHPSLIEGIQECCRMLLGKSIFKPSIFKESMLYKSYTDGQYYDKSQDCVGLRCEI